MTDKVFVRCGLSSGRLFCSTSIASLVQVRAMSSRRSRTRMLDAMAICRHSTARSLHTSEVSMAVTPTAVLPGTPTSLGSAGFPTIEEALPDGPQAPPNRPRLRHRQGQHRLQRVRGEWEIGRIYEVRGAPSICGGSGRCTSTASRRTCAPTIALRLWRKPRRSFRSAGMPGRPGRR